MLEPPEETRLSEEDLDLLDNNVGYVYDEPAKHSGRFPFGVVQEVKSVPIVKQSETPEIRLLQSREDGY